jgi:hypothetical protein
VVRRAFTLPSLRGARALRGALGALVAFALLACVPAAGAAIVSGGGGGRLGVQPLTPSVPEAPTASRVLMGPLLGPDQGIVYHGGPVLHGVTTYAIFWDPDHVFDSSTESLVGGFLSNVADASGSNDNVFSVAAQYTDAAGSAQYAQSFGGSYLDSDPYPTSGGCGETTPTAPTCLTDSQITGELEGFVASHSLASGLGSLFVVLTPDSVVTCLDGGDQCSNNAYCSLHSYASDGSSPLLYIEIPFTELGSASAAKGCQDDGNPLVQTPSGDSGFGDVALKSLGHEMLETISDPLLNAWYDSAGDEIADLCNGVTWSPDSFLPVLGGDASAGTLWNQAINGANYYLQGAWSNATGACALSASPVPGFNAPASAFAGARLSFVGAPGTNAAVNSYAWSFGDGQSSDGQSVTHTFAAAGVYTVTLSVTDSFGDTGSVSRQVDVTARAGRTAGASAAHSPRRSTMRCGRVRHRPGRVEVRRCTRTVVSHSSARACKRAARGKHGRVCNTVVRTVTRRAACRSRRARGAAKWSLRCAAAVVVRRRG